MTQTAGWDGILADGETIVWQGQPEPGIAWRDAISATSAFGVVFTGFALFWMAMAATIIGGGSGPGFPFSMFPLFGLPFLAVGLYFLVGHVIVDAYVRSTTWYTLTDRTAFVASNAFGQRKLSSYPIREMPFLELDDTAPGSVLFWHEDSPRSHRTGRIGFRRIAEARAVHARLREARGALNFAERQARAGA
jgi:hypothetical protein